MIKTKTWLVLLLTLVCAGALAAATTVPATSTAPTTSVAPDLSALLQSPGAAPAGAHFAAIMHCEPPTRFFCVNASCWCGVSCGSRGVASFTCNEATNVSNCTCNP
jgi:hypothetical protein